MRVIRERFARFGHGLVIRCLLNEMLVQLSLPLANRAELHKLVLWYVSLVTRSVCSQKGAPSLFGSTAMHFLYYRQNFSFPFLLRRIIGRSRSGAKLHFRLVGLSCSEMPLLQ